MTPDDLRAAVNQIIALSSDDEAAHTCEDRLHLKIIDVFCPSWVKDEVLRLSKADFARWCA